MLAEITIYWCLLKQVQDLDDFDPHGVSAVQRYVSHHPGICRVDDPVQLDEISIEDCQSHAVLNYVPGWEAKHPGAVVLGAPCTLRNPAILDIRPDTRAGE